MKFSFLIKRLVAILLVIFSTMPIAFADLILAKMIPVHDGASPSLDSIYKLEDDKDYIAEKKWNISKNVASVEVDEKFERVTVTLDEEGKKTFEIITNDAKGRHLAIILSNELLCAPVILTPSKNGVLIINLSGHQGDKAKVFNSIKSLVKITPRCYAPN